MIGTSGKDYLIFETVGVGQGEVEISNVSDINIVVLSPESGDEVQFMKAGLLEIADLYVINKSDRPGSDKLKTLIYSMTQIHNYPYDIKPPIINIQANTGQNIDQLYREIKAHYLKLKIKGLIKSKRIKRYKHRINNLIKDVLLSTFWSESKIDVLEELIKKIDTNKKSPHELAQQILSL